MVEVASEHILRFGLAWPARYVGQADLAQGFMITRSAKLCNRFISGTVKAQ